MHPAYSVILFTTSSGAGYGLLFWLSLGHALGLLPDDRWLAFFAMALALGLVTAGLLASTLHLGHPERAIGAFSQWRSSWLSREGVAAVATYVPSGLLALIWLLGLEASLTVLAFLSAIGAAVTVYCTGMIYASLRTIRQWNLTLVPLIYLTVGAATGAILLGFVLAIFGHAPGWITVVTLVALVVCGALKLQYWQRIDGDKGRYTAEMATGLGALGTVRPLDPPHTRSNFVMREMGYQVGRQHAQKLRKAVLAGLFAAPFLLVLAAWFIGWPVLFFTLAVLAATAGVLVERWLFFAEAEHVSQLYYGAARA